MYVLTVRQPWAWAILRAGKDVENRSITTRVRERIGIHAGLAVDADAFDTLRSAGFDVPGRDELPRGLILGTVRITDCTRDSPSAWARPGAWHWALHDARELAEPIPHSGRLWLHQRADLDEALRDI